MALMLLNSKEIFNSLSQNGFLLYEKEDNIYTMVDLKCKSFAMFDCTNLLATVYTYPGKLFTFDKKDLDYYIKYLKKDIVVLPSISNITNDLDPDYKIQESSDMEFHPFKNDLSKLQGLSDWILLENGDAVRYYLYIDYNLYGSRAAYVSKSARIRIKDNQWLTVGDRSSDYGMSLANLKACDDMLIKLGFNIQGKL